jgi:UDP-glucose-4-epimerase GalE
MPESVPIREDHPQNPVNPYGYGKLVVERVLRDYEHASKLRSVSLRYFNAAGADPEGEIGEGHDPETHLIPLVLQTAAGRRSHVVINGADYPTPDGTCVRDYIHVSDLADAHVLALRFLQKEGKSECINLGTGAGASVKTVIDLARRVTGKPIAAQLGPRRAGDPPVLVAEAARARDVLKWRPRYPELETQIQHAWAWMKTHG